MVIYHQLLSLWGSLVRIVLCLSLIILLLSSNPVAPVRASSITNIFGPTGSGQFGSQVISLPNGNLVVNDPGFTPGGPAELGAVYLYDGKTFALISALTGRGYSNDNGSITILSNGNFVVSSPYWDGSLGAVTWCSEISGCNGDVSEANSLVGSQNDEYIGRSITALKNGSYVVASQDWSNGLAVDAGAVTWCSGTSGCNGDVSEANSLVGSHAGDYVGGSSPYDSSETTILELNNGNYVVSSPNWSNGSAASAGAVTWCSGTTGCAGPVSAINSLVGGQTGDRVGSTISDPIKNIIALKNGTYVVASSYWANGSANSAGAVTLCSGSGGCVGLISAANSLVGSHPNDCVGKLVQLQNTFIVLNNDYFVIVSNEWANGSSNSYGAVTLCGGKLGCVGAISKANSLVANRAGDVIYRAVGLTNGNYVVNPVLSGGVSIFILCNGTSGCRGDVSSAGGLIGGGDIMPLANGNYVIVNNYWSNDIGIVTWCSGVSGCQGAVSSANSLVGSQTEDQVGSSILPLQNGDYVVGSPHWANQTGASTWCSGITGCKGVVSAANSLVGSQMGDLAGSSYALTNGNYVVSSPGWSNGLVSGVGAVTLCSGTGGCQGVVSTQNSLVGSQANDGVGDVPDVPYGDVSGGVIPLENGSYVVKSPNWSNGNATQAGAVTWCSGTSGCVGPVSDTNSLVGSHTGDKVGYFQVGADYTGHGSTWRLILNSITNLKNGNYVVSSPSLGAVTWCSGTRGCQGAVSAANSLLAQGWVYPQDDGNYVVRSPVFQGTGFAWMAGPYTTPCSGSSALPTGAITDTNTITGDVWAYNNDSGQVFTGDPANNRVAIYTTGFPILTSAVASGDWNDPSTWDLGVPKARSLITIRGGMVISLSGGSAMGMDLTIQPGGSLSMGSATLTLNGSFTNQGSFTSGSGTITFAGMGEHTLAASSPTAFNNLTVGGGAILIDSPAADLFSVHGRLLNQGTLRKSQSVTGLGLFSFGLTGAQVSVIIPGGLTRLQVDRVDQNLPNSGFGYATGSFSTQTGAYWSIRVEAGPAPYDVNLKLAHHLGSPQTFVCQPVGAGWDCERSASGSADVWRDELNQVAGNWTVGWQPSAWLYAPFVGN